MPKFASLGARFAGIALSVDWPPPYKDTTEKYSSQVRLSNDHRSLVGYVAGQPLPLLDSNDPNIGTKIPSFSRIA